MCLRPRGWGWAFATPLLLQKSLTLSEPQFSHLQNGHQTIPEFAPDVVPEGFPGGASGKEPACQCRKQERHEFSRWVGKILWRKTWKFTLVFLPGESHGQKSLVGCSPWGLRVGHDRSDWSMHHSTDRWNSSNETALCWVLGICL